MQLHTQSTLLTQVSTAIYGDMKMSSRVQTPWGGGQSTGFGPILAFCDGIGIGKRCNKKVKQVTLCSV